ncbi:putative gustatory receptor 28b [Solenopsis invicta]|uniref:putative gustatory receptor 28b n=1 Tax=Solenopsis invicta TaxID=13686 RepID=UPI00193D5B61|nr:putative gustatory receptor 28b [Solenopsis invicta]
MFLLYLHLMMYQIDMLHMNCVFVLKACFKQINDNLMNLTEPVTNAEPHILREIYYNERNPLVELEALKKQHLAISKTVQVLNKIFSFQLLVTIIRNFAGVTFMLYFVLMRWKIDMVADNLNSQLYDMFMIYNIIRSALKMVLLTWACESGKNQAVDINTTVHSVLNFTSDKQIKRELQLFALQLMHHKNVFSAKWFNMDIAFLTAVSDRTFTSC